MPKDANLDLNLEAESQNIQPCIRYAWLDVLCLRQEGRKSEHLRLEEWKLDMPHHRIGVCGDSLGGVLLQRTGSTTTFDTGLL